MGHAQGDRKQDCQNISAAVNMSGTRKMKMKKEGGEKKTPGEENASQGEKKHTRKET